MKIKIIRASRERWYEFGKEYEVYKFNLDNYKLCKNLTMKDEDGLIPVADCVIIDVDYLNEQIKHLEDKINQLTCFIGSETDWKATKIVDPCPSCGGESIEEITDWSESIANPKRIIKCKKCGIRTPEFDSFYQASLIWNNYKRKVKK